jgi:hypothetical protein
MSMQLWYLITIMGTFEVKTSNIGFVNKIKVILSTLYIKLLLNDR